MNRSQRSRVLHVLAVIAIAALAFGLRWRAIPRLPIDYDEPWCFETAQQIAEVLRSRELARLMETNPTPEHPQLAKTLLAIAILSAPESPPSPERRSVFYPKPRLPEKQLIAARRVSGVLGTLEALLLAWIHPLAGLLLAIHTYTVKFTSEAMIEALPALTSLAAVASYLRFKQTRRDGWLIGSAVALGLTAAGKYVYAVVAVPILIDWWLELRPSAADLLARTRLTLLWGFASLLVFFAVNPYFWPEPLPRLKASVSYLAEFSTGSIVREAHLPYWQPLAWLTIYIPNDAPAERPYLLRLDPLITLFALLGLVPLWRKERIWVLWLVVVLTFLLLWNTKWPHYILILSAPLCVCAAEGIRLSLAVPLRVIRWLRSRA